jgi:chemotaxis protein MotB
MAAESNVAPVIIKRKKIVKGGGHHGGAWKVAYADFVTAMMAFFMLMWLLNATTDKQRKGLADYFSPTIPINRVSGGGTGAFGGTDMFTEDVLTQSGKGSNVQTSDLANKTVGMTGFEYTGTDNRDNESFESIEAELKGRGGESLVTEESLKHIVTKVTDEGFFIELFDIEGSPLFEEGGDYPTPVLRDLLRMIAGVISDVDNKVAVTGHVRSQPIVLAQNPVWDLSMARAEKTRIMLQAAGLNPARVFRVTGKADRSLYAEDRPMSHRNNRVEIILLRPGKEK